MLTPLYISVIKKWRISILFVVPLISFYRSSDAGFQSKGGFLPLACDGLFRFTSRATFSYLSNLLVDLLHEFPEFPHRGCVRLTVIGERQMKFKEVGSSDEVQMRLQ